MSTINIRVTWRWRRWWTRPILWAWIACTRVGVTRKPTRSDLSRMIVISLAALLFAACTPPITPTPDSGDAQVLGDALPDGGACSAMCANLRRLACPEGLDPKCVAVCAHDVAQPLTQMPIACWASAQTKEAARACVLGNSGHLGCP